MSAVVALDWIAPAKNRIDHLYRREQGPFQSPCKRRRFEERDWRAQAGRRRRLKMQSMMVAFRAAMTRPGEMEKPRPAAAQPPAKTER